MPQEALQAGTPPGFYFQQQSWTEGRELLRAACLTVHRISQPLPPASLLPPGHFTCKCTLQMVSGFSMTGPGNRKKTPCLNLGIGAEPLSEKHLTRSRGHKCQTGVLSSRQRRSWERGQACGHRGYKTGCTFLRSSSLNTGVSKNLRLSRVWVNIILPFNVRW